MSIREESRQEAERRYPIRLPYNRDFEIRDREQKAFEAGAVWRDEQADREPSDAEVEAAAQAILPGRAWWAPDHKEGASDPRWPAEQKAAQDKARRTARAALLAAQEVRRGE